MHLEARRPVRLPTKTTTSNVTTVMVQVAMVALHRSRARNAKRSSTNSVLQLTIMQRMLSKVEELVEALARLSFYRSSKQPRFNSTMLSQLLLRPTMSRITSSRSLSSEEPVIIPSPLEGETLRTQRSYPLTYPSRPTSLSIRRHVREADPISWRRVAQGLLTLPRMVVLSRSKRINS